MKDKFKTKAGMLTPYALHCGYIEVKESELTGVRVTLEWDSCSYAVKSFNHKLNIRLYWENFETLTAARKFYKSISSGNKL